MPAQLSDHRPVIAQLVLPCSHVRSSSETPSVFEVAFQKLTLSLSCLPPTANGAPPGKPFIRIYLSCGSLPQHAPADHAKFAEINDGYDKVDVTNPDDQLLFAPTQVASMQSASGSDLSPEHEINLGSGSSSVSPHLLADSGRMPSVPPLVNFFCRFLAIFCCILRSHQVAATLAKREMLMNQKLSGSLILAADIDSRRASVLPQALQDKVCAIHFAHVLVLSFHN
jgi:hypothetical protein